MQEFISAALFSGMPLYAVWMFTTPVVNLLFTRKDFRPSRAKSMLAAGLVLIFISAANVKFGNPDAIAHLTGIFIVAPLLAAITHYFLERRKKSKLDSSP